MNELRLKYPVRMMRRIMNVSASGYYAWVDRPLSKRAQEEVRLELEIMAAHQRNRQTYGPERLQRDLAEHGVRVGVCRIKRIRQKLGIRSAYAVNRRGDSRLPLTPRTDCQLRITCWASSSRSVSPMPCG